MASSEYKIVTESFAIFADKADRFLHIKNEQNYLEALSFIEELIDDADDSEIDPKNDLIDFISSSIANYEENSLAFSEFDRDLREIDPAVSTLRLIIDQYSLTSSDLKEEIGSRSLVSMILSGKRSLTKDHIYKLSERFNLDPSIFFPRKSNRSYMDASRKS